ncbi:MAG: exodeoxyribonuclease VII small subunit [Acidobacteriota bacterium]|nr:exodeoxyribonuclease VII small subunit [Acidobacteriota bacterium]
MSEHEQQVLAEMKEPQDRPQKDPVDMTKTSKKKMPGQTNKTATAANPGSDELPFSDAVTELEAILHRIESEEIDIDQLASQLKRATGLLEICRARVRKAEAEVTQVVQALAPDPSSGSDSEDD